MTTGDRIKAMRIKHGMTQEELGAKVGVKKSAIYKYETGIVVNLKRSTIEKLAKVLEVSPSWLIGIEDGPSAGPSSIPPGFEPLPELSTVPVVGRIACGTPILAEQNIDGTVCIPARWRAAFILVCKGESMAPKIHDGDLVAIRKQPEVENGEIAAVRIGEEATLKRVFRHDNLLELRPENSAFESIILVGEDMGKATIEGKAVGLCRDL